MKSLGVAEISKWVQILILTLGKEICLTHINLVSLTEHNEHKSNSYDDSRTLHYEYCFY